MNTFARTLSLLALALFTLTATAAPTPTEGRLYAPGAFDRLDIDGSAIVKLTQGEHDQVFIAGDDDVQREVEVELSNGLLHISPTSGWKFWNSGRLHIDVQMRNLSRITLSGNSDLRAPGPVKSDELTISISGAGLARFDELSAGMLRFDISGSGDGQLAGQAKQLSLSVSGKGKLQAEQLRTTNATVSISGVGHAHLWVVESLRVSVSGVGNVDYWGQPTVRRSVSGVGTVTGRGDKH